MIYAKTAGALIIVSILCAIDFLIIKIERKRSTLEGLIYKKAPSDVNGIVNMAKKVVMPLLPPQSDLDRTKQYLEELNYKNTSPERFYLMANGIGMLTGAMYFGTLLLFVNVFLAIPGIVLGIATGYRIPFILLKSKYESLQEEKRLGILPYVEMLQIACDAGLTLTLAIERIYEYYPTSLALEFKKANIDFMTNLKTRKQSFMEIIDRVGGEEIRFLIESIIQSLEIGTPMKNTLKSIADSIRRDLHMNVINRGQKAKWKNFIISICFQFPPFIFIIAGPGVAGLMGSL